MTLELARRAGTLAVVALLSTAAFSQSLTLPQASPEASVTQTVGLTKMAISYHRPGVKGRVIWGGLVPYGKVWRAGANENTTISFDSDVTVNGQPLAAGTYGLHMIPTATEWTVIFSRDTKAWGSYAYDAMHDALRVRVMPEAKSDSVERMTFTFDDPTDDSVTVALRWEKLRVPFVVKIDTPRVVLASLREQLTGLAQFSQGPWVQAANYALRNDDIADANRWADRALTMGRSFAALRAKAAVMEKRGDDAQAKALRDEAMTVATPSDLASLGGQLVGQKKYDEAIAILTKSAAANASVNVYRNLGDAYAQKGDKAAARTAYEKALQLATDEDDKRELEEAMHKLAP